MEELINKIITCVEFGKIDKNAPYPLHLKGEPGADELTQQALSLGVNPSDILNKALIVAMNEVGRKFSENKIYVPQMLLSAKAMNSAMRHLKPFFQSGEVKRKGTIIMGTVMGDLHDIGKNLCCIMFEGAGWEVIDLGVDVDADRFISSLVHYPGAIVGMSALLTTTMNNMEPMIHAIKQQYPQTKIIVGGAPLNSEYAKKIGADGFGKDPQESLICMNTFS